MSIDIGAIGEAVYALVFYVSMVVYAFVAYRGFEMAGAFVSRVYRTHARWVAAMSLALLLTIIAGHAPYIGNIGIGVVTLGFISVFFIVLALLPFVDSTILVALDMDFFHRNTLYWRRTRVLVYFLLYGIIAFFLLIIYLASQPVPPGWVVTATNSLAFEVVFIGIIGGALGYSVLTLVACSRRAPDIVFRRHLLRLGLVFAFGTVAILNDFTVGNLVLDGALGGVVVPFLWYLAAMSLSPIGRIEKGAVSSSLPVPGAVTPSSPAAGPKLQGGE